MNYTHVRLCCSNEIHKSMWFSMNKTYILSLTGCSLACCSNFEQISRPWPHAICLYLLFILYQNLPSLSRNVVSSTRPTGTRPIVCRIQTFHPNAATTKIFTDSKRSCHLTKFRTRGGNSSSCFCATQYKLTKYLLIWLSVFVFWCWLLEHCLVKSDG